MFYFFIRDYLKFFSSDGGVGGGMKSTASSHVTNSVACNVSMMYIVLFLKRCVKRHIFACKKQNKKTNDNVTDLSTVET